MRTIKQLIKRYFGHFAYFYGHLRYRIFVAMALSFSVGLLDGFGLAMFLPLLQLVNGESTASGEDLGGLSFLVDGFAQIGIPLNLVSVLIIIVFFFSLKGVAQFARQYYTVVVRLYFIRKLRFNNVNSFANYNYRLFVAADAGRIQNTMSGEVQRVSQAYNNYFNTVQSGVLMLIYLILAFATNAQFALLVAVGGVLSNLAYRQIYRRTKENSVKISRGGHEFQSLLIQMVSFFKYLKSTGFMKAYGRKLKDSILYIEHSQKKIGFYNSILTATREPLIICVVVVVIFIQVNYLSAGLGGIILSLMFFYRALNYVMLLQTAWNNFLNVSGSLENMNEFMAELKDGQEAYGSGEFKHFREKISLTDVSFTYDIKPVLENVNLDIDRNSTIAFVGESGSGKTTIVNLITGLLQADKGSLNIDGINYSDLDLRTLQERIGYITQDPVIFSDSIYNNVTKWAPKTEENLDKFWAAMKQAAIADYVLNLPGKEDSPLGNNGIQVSGGQKQRMSIARELFKDVEILVMDEATSALDTETERSIQENIDALKGRLTIIIIAHRFSSIRHADKIVLLKDGLISDVGNYNQLLESSSEFGKMVKMQEV